MKSYQFSKFYKRFCKEREKMLIHPTLNEDKKTTKRWTLLYYRLFYKALKIIIYHFYLVLPWPTKSTAVYVIFSQKI